MDLPLGKSKSFFINITVKEWTERQVLLSKVSDSFFNNLEQIANSVLGDIGQTFRDHGIL
jgi:hypothetical protein